MNKRIPFLIRWFLSGLIVGFIYIEAGPWTCLFAALVTISIEIMVWQIKKTADALNDLAEALERSDDDG